jgi:hypothetical protein
MKRKATAFMVLIAVLMGALLVFPADVMARGYGHYNHRRGDLDWVGPAAIIAGGLLVGTAIIASSPRTPVYVRPAPGDQAYQYPDAAGPACPQTQSGHWVMVPGQWVDGAWVPQHNVWVPAP